jgi:rod shape-determining protein MreD
MTQPNFTSSRILLPARSWFIALTLILALLANMLPTAYWPGIPDWVALVLCFWCIREPRRIGMGWAFVLGLAMDVADGAILGQHCFAYVLLAYAAASLSRRILWFPLAQQALQVLPLLIGAQALPVATSRAGAT